MRNRWAILAVLFAVRAVMAMQFQSVASIAPLFARHLGIDIADVGILIGLYFAPGIALALPGVAIGQKYGDKATVLIGLSLMLAGGFLMVFQTSWSGQIIGRLVSGTGGVIVNVMMTKMIADSFADRELSTAMAIFVNSWPAGIAMSLLILPPIGSAYEASTALLMVCALISIVMFLLVQFYEAPIRMNSTVTARPRFGRSIASAVLASGAIWALYNIGYAMVFSFAPSMLVERGWSINASGSTVSVVIWLSAISVPVGGFISDYTKRYDTVMVACWLLTAALMFLASHGAPVVPTIIAIGLVGGLAAGPIMRLPALVLQQSSRAFGMGVFYTTFYIGLLAGPTMGGRYAAWAGSAGAALNFGAAALILCPLLLWMFSHFAKACATMPAHQT